ncbi:MAG: FAD:protein FMN transferase [Lachnospiraceae bacterium]|nr:FAD:protein FMN transferase [Lachnospiraceae bacterium]
MKSYGKHFVGMMVFFLVISVLLIWISMRQRHKPEAEKQEECSTTGFAFDTVYTITIYHGGDQKMLDACTAKCAQFEQIFSRTLETSELYQINRLSKEYKAGNQETIEDLQQEGKLPAYQALEDGSLEIQVSEPLAELIAAGIRYGEISQGNFDITIEPVSSLWDFTADHPVLPEPSALEHALPYVNYRTISLQKQKLRLNQPGIGLDLGGIAKGYIADQLKEYLTGQGVDSALIDLGGNILCVGGKPDGSDFRIGIQQPFADRNETIATVALQGQSVVSSGIYERYFMEQDTMYHHILDPGTGYPRESDLVAVTIISDRSVDGDGFSTTCFGLGLEEGMKLINQTDGVTAAFITRDEKLHYAQGFQEFMLTE